MSEYIGKNVLVTGANRGLGLSFVQYLLKDYPEVKLLFAAARNPAKSEELQKLKQQYGNRLQILQLDVASDSSIEQAFKVVEKQLNGEGLDLLLNNAGITAETFFPLLNKSVQLNKRPAKILNLSSHLSSRVFNNGQIVANDFAYAASKSALNMYSHILAKAPYASEFIVVALAPGHVKTDMGGASASLTTDESIPPLLKIAAKAQKESSGKLIDFRGVVLDM